MYGFKRRVHGGTSRRVISVLIACILLFTSTGIQVTQAAGNSYCSYGNFDSYSENDTGRFSSIVINGSGVPAACYYNANTKHLYYAERNSSPVVIDPADNVGQYCSMTKNGSYLHVSYYDAGNKDLKYAYWNGSSWTVDPQAVDSSESVGKYSSIAVDPNGYPHISYYDEDNGDLKHAYKDSQGWHIEKVDVGGNSNSGTSAINVGKYSAIAVDSSGRIHIAYYDDSSDDLRYATRSSSGSWSGGWDLIDNAGDVGKFCSIAIDSSRKAHVSYYDASSSKLKYAYQNSSGNWQVTTVSDSSNTGKYTDIACDSNNRIHVSFYDTANDTLKYGFYCNSKWQTVAVDERAGSSDDQNTSITLDNRDQAHISYYDTTSSDSMYATLLCPLVTGTNPGNADSGTSATKSITVSFNKSIAEGANIKGITLTGGNTSSYYYGNNGSITTTSTVSGNTLTIDHSKLSFDTEYTLTIPKNAVVAADSRDNTLVDAYSITFKTGADNGPTVDSTNPTNGKKDVTPGDPIYVTFSENISYNASLYGYGYNTSGSITVKDPDGKTVKTDISAKDNVLTIKPASSSGVLGGLGFSSGTSGSDADYVSYTYDKTYTVRIPSGSVSSTNGKQLASEYKFSFTTLPKGPTVASIDPSGTEVPLSKTITVKFSDTIYTGSSWSNIALRNSDGNIINSNISLNKTEITIDPISDLVMGVVYTITIPKDAVKDDDGRIMNSDYKVSFTTIKPIIPDVPTRVKIKSTTASSIAITWNASKSALSYNVYRRTGKEGYTKLINTTAINYTDISAKKKTTYIYAISAIGTGGESAKSTEVPAYIGMTLPQFADVANGDWFKVYVDALAKRNAVSGYSDDLFHPESNVTRAEFAKMLCLAMGWPLRTPKNPTYQDVSKSHWAFAYVETASSHKAFSGYIDRSFKPDEKLFRADVAKVAATALRLKKGSSKLKDIDKSWAKNYINMCVSARVINGFPDRTYKPGLMITRAEAARIICGMVTYNSRK
jgi:hypothetical protein